VKAIIDRLLNKPAWQSSDPAVRAEAVLHLPSSEHGVLLSVAREDEEPRVRRAAAKKLVDADALSDLARNDDDETVREEALARLTHIAVHTTEHGPGRTALATLSEPRHLSVVARSAALAAVREAAVEALRDSRALAAVVREGQDMGTRLLALARIDDPSTLLALALRSEQKAIAVAAVDRLENAEAIRTVARKARLGAAARRARARIEREEAIPSPPAAATTTTQQDEKEREDYERARAEQERQAREHQADFDERVRLCESVERAVGEAIPDTIEKTRAAWNALPRLVGVDADAMHARFQAAVSSAGRRHETFLSALARREELSTLVARAEEMAAADSRDVDASEWASLELRWKQLADACDQPDLQGRFEGAVERRLEHDRSTREERERRDRENLARLAALAERAEALLASGEPRLREIEQVSREVRSALDSPGHCPSRQDRERALERLEAARKALYPRVQQLREDTEWKRWANVSVQEQLCARAEALASEKDPAVLARKLKDLDARWKQAREAPKESAEALWTRFRAARDVLKARTDDYFAKQAEELAQNLAKKEALCERAEALADSTDWVKTAETLRGFQTEWKQIGPVPRAQSRKVWNRFRKPCDHFFTRWQEQRGERSKRWAENLQKKEALCERAEAMMESDDWEATAATIKSLQAEWRQIGAVKRSRSEAVWRRFREACDRFFDRYKHRDTLALQAAQEARERICSELEALLPTVDPGSPPPEDLVARLQTAQTAWRQAGELPRDTMISLTERFSRVRDGLVERYAQAFAGTELDPEASRRKAESLIGRVERLLEDLAPAGASATFGTTEELAARLRDALAANTIGGREAAEARWHSATSEVEAAQAAWRRLGPIPGAEGRALRERFDAACRRFFELRPQPSRSRAGARRPSRNRT
jgi:DNA polymerase III psi subunit